jgi:hypothetical protein
VPQTRNGFAGVMVMWVRVWVAVMVRG